jgi:hypothetical protein
VSAELIRSAYELATDQARIEARERNDGATTIYCPTCNQTLGKVTPTSPGLLWQSESHRSGPDLLARILADNQHDSDPIIDALGITHKKFARKVSLQSARIIDWSGEPDDYWHDGSPITAACCSQSWLLDVVKLIARCTAVQHPGMRTARHRRVSVADIATRD